MSHPFDDFSTSLAERIPRRQSLRFLGSAFAGAFFAPLGIAAVDAATDPCIAFCKCRTTKQRNQCLKTCRACDKKPRRVGGSCGSYFCCPKGTIPCGSYCADLRDDFYNCGACGRVCEEPGDFEYGFCVEGECEYACFEGAERCDGLCTYLDSDPFNCGACGNVCGGATPYCDQGVCTACPPGLASCGGACVDVAYDPNNCGSCGNVCGGATPYCSNGTCTSCAGAICHGVCVDLNWDSFNCGACGNVCPPGSSCAFGICGTPCPDCG